MGLSTFDEHAPLLIALVVPAGAGIAIQGFVPALGVSGRIDAIYLRQWDAVDHVVQFYIQHAGGGTTTGAVNVPAAPLAGVAIPIEALALLGFTAQAGIVLGPTDAIQFSTPVALAAGYMSMLAVGGTF